MNLDTLSLYLTLAFAIIYIVLFIKFYGSMHLHVKFDWPHFVARVAVFGAISTVLYVVPIFNIGLPFMPGFLTLHFDEIPAFIAGYAYGPLTAFAVIVIKTIVKLPFSTTMMVGELSDLLFSSAFVLPAVIVYKKKRNLKGVAIGFAAGTILQVVVATVMNVYAMLPFYMFVMGFTYDGLLYVCQLANPNITDLGWTYAFLAIVPFNLIKDAIVLTVTFLVYRSIHRLLHFEKN